MRTEYRVSSGTLAGRLCIEHVGNHADKKLFGKNGFIFGGNKDRYAAMITNYRIINQSFPWSDFKAEPGRDKLIYFDVRQMRQMLKCLRIPISPEDQLKLAEAYERGDSSKNASAAK